MLNGCTSLKFTDNAVVLSGLFEQPLLVPFDGYVGSLSEVTESPFESRAPDNSSMPLT